LASLAIHRPAESARARRSRVAVLSLPEGEHCPGLVTDCVGEELERHSGVVRRVAQAWSELVACDCLAAHPSSCDDP
jgi:hypothetical protein